LTALPEPGQFIDGVIARVPHADWANLDEREYAYERHTVSADVEHKNTDTITISTYTIPTSGQLQDHPPFPILQSYLDVVLQGYIQQLSDAAQCISFRQPKTGSVPS